MKQEEHFANDLPEDLQRLLNGVSAHPSFKTSKASWLLANSRSAPSQSLQVVCVDSSHLHLALCQFPWLLYRNDSHWVAPVRSLQRQIHQINSTHALAAHGQKTCLTRQQFDYICESVRGIIRCGGRCDRSSERLDAKSCRSHRRGPGTCFNDSGRVKSEPRLLLDMRCENTLRCLNTRRFSTLEIQP